MKPYLFYYMKLSKLMFICDIQKCEWAVCDWNCFEVMKRLDSGAWAEWNETDDAALWTRYPHTHFSFRIFSFVSKKADKEWKKVKRLRRVWRRGFEIQLPVPGYASILKWAFPHRPIGSEPECARSSFQL